MMKSAILTIGTEILFGQIVNSNAAFLSKNLNDEGVDVLYHYTVGDNPKRMEDALRLLLKDCDLVITTGGLGPTKDDITTEIVAKVAGEKVVLDEPSYDKIKKSFETTGRVMTENNIRQAYVPEHARILPNNRGLAPGFVSEFDGKAVMCLPGPPWEMEDMFRDFGLEYIHEKNDENMEYCFVKTVGIGESALETALMDLIEKQSDPTIATYCNEGETYLRIASKRNTKEEADEAISQLLDEIKKRIGKYIYSYEKESLTEVIGRVLKDRGLTLSSAESCTGGLFADSHIQNPGSSEYFKMALVTYTEEAKMKVLGVKKETLEKYTAVSEETAIEMVEGLERVSGSDICVAVTGLCGPGDGSLDKPVGLVYTAIRFNGKTVCLENRFRNSGRNLLRKRSVMMMNKMIFEILGGI